MSEESIFKRRLRPALEDRSLTPIINISRGITNLLLTFLGKTTDADLQNAATTLHNLGFTNSANLELTLKDNRTALLATRMPQDPKLN